MEERTIEIWDDDATGEWTVSVCDADGEVYCHDGYRRAYARAEREARRLGRELGHAVLVLGQHGATRTIQAARACVVDEGGRVQSTHRSEAAARRASGRLRRRLGTEVEVVS